MISGSLPLGLGSSIVNSTRQALDMPIKISGKTYFRTAEAAEMIGVSKPTLLRWIKDRKISDVKRDRRGWRIFSQGDVKRIRKWAQTTT